MIRRSRPRIRSWMVRKSITGAAIARAIGVSDALVCSTIAGQRNNRKVLQYLRDLGCPASFLKLPDDLQPLGVTP